MPTHKKDKRIQPRLAALLASRPGERAVHTFLKANPYLVRQAFNVHAWNCVYELSEFRFGADFRADFLVLSADSGAWHATFVELESPNAKPFNRNGTPARALARGLAQLTEWEIWLEKNESLLRLQLATFLKAKRAAAQCSNAADHQLAHTEIVDPRTVIFFEYIVMVGRRAAFDQDAQERRGNFHEKGLSIATYDRLLEAAKRLDSAAY
jgi:hypothetical protein